MWNPPRPTPPTPCQGKPLASAERRGGAEVSNSRDAASGQAATLPTTHFPPPQGLHSPRVPNTSPPPALPAVGVRNGNQMGLEDTEGVGLLEGVPARWAVS